MYMYTYLKYTMYICAYLRYIKLHIYTYLKYAMHIYIRYINKCTYIRILNMQCIYIYKIYK